MTDFFKKQSRILERFSLFCGDFYRLFGVIKNTTCRRFMSYYSRRSYSNSTIFSGYIVDTSPSKFTMWSIIQNYRNVREFVGRKLRKRCIFSLQGKFIFFKVLNNNIIANLSISSIKKVMFGNYRCQNDDVLVPWCQLKKS